jgi:hypothetical protein
MPRDYEKHVSFFFKSNSNMELNTLQLQMCDTPYILEKL